MTRDHKTGACVDISLYVHGHVPLCVGVHAICVWSVFLPCMGVCSGEYLIYVELHRVLRSRSLRNFKNETVKQLTKCCESGRALLVRELAPSFGIVGPHTD